MNAILATNFKDLNEHIINNFDNINVIIHDIQTQTEAVEQIISSENIDFILLTDLLRGEKGLGEFLELIYSIKAPTTKLYYIAQEYNEAILKVIAKCQIKYFKKHSQTLDEFIDSICEDYQQQEGKLVIKEKIIVKKETVDRLVTVGFKKLVLTIWDNPEFGCELAYIIAKLTDHKVMLIDLDLLSPKADMILNIPKHPEGINNQGIFTMSGLNIIMDSIEKDIFTPELLYEAAIRRNENKNLNILTGNYSLENYEYYSDQSLTKLIEYAYRTFEITILLANKSIYDEYTLRALESSDYNIIAAKADLPTLREYNRYLAFLRNIKQIPINKTKFVAYEYLKGVDIEEKLINEIVEKTYIGSIRHSKIRQKYRNIKAPYVKRMDEHTKADYIKLLASFNIVPKTTLKDNIKMHFRTIYTSTIRPVRKLLKQKLKIKGVV